MDIAPLINSTRSFIATSPTPDLLSIRSRYVRQGCGIESTTVVVHVQHDLIAQVRQSDHDRRRIRVFPHVGQRFLQRPQEDDVQRSIDLGRIADDLERAWSTRGCAPPRTRDAQRVCDRMLAQNVWHKGLDDTPRLHQPGPGRVPGEPNVVLNGCGPGRKFRLGRFELHDDAGEVLGDGVVKIAGDPVSLLKHSRRSLLNEKLSPRRVEFLNEETAPFVLDEERMNECGHHAAKEDAAPEHDPVGA
jgi:hypothetical protein